MKFSDSDEHSLVLLQHAEFPSIRHTKRLYFHKLSKFLFRAFLPPAVAMLNGPTHNLVQMFTVQHIST